MTPPTAAPWATPKSSPWGEAGVAHALPLRPEEVPPVSGRALLDAWDTAREAAAAELDGPERLLRFARDGSEEAVELRLQDRDARCWAEAIDLTRGLDTMAGMAVFLRLLALLDAMGRLDFLRGMFTIEPGGTLLHPSLLAAAAELPLDRAARLSETGLRRRLARLPAGAEA